jgi:hypothetical protein
VRGLESPSLMGKGFAARFADIFFDTFGVEDFSNGI